MQKIQDKSQKEFADIKHHIGTIQSQQLNDDELSLVFERLKYQVGALSQQVTKTKDVKVDVNLKTDKSQVKKKSKYKKKSSSKLPSQQQSSSQQQSVQQSVLLPKIIKEPTSTKTEIKRVPSKKLGKLKQGHMYQAQVLNRDLRLNPFADLPLINDEDLNKGIYNLMISGIIPKDVNVNAAFRRGGDIIQTQQVQLMTEKSRFYSAPQQENLTRYKLQAPNQMTGSQKKQQQYQQSINTLSPSRLQMPNSKSPEKPKAKYIVEIKNNHFQQDLAYQMKYFHIWGAISAILVKLEKIASGQLDGDMIAKLALSQIKVTQIELYRCYLSKPIMERLYILNRKQFNFESAVIKIQASIRMYIQSKKYQHQKKIVQKVIRIQKEFRLKMQYQYTIQEVRKKLGEQINTLEMRQNQFKQESLQQNRIEIHIPSYTITECQRLTMSNFKNREGLSLTRLFALKDPKLTIVFVTYQLPEEVFAYYQKLLEISNINVEGRLHFIIPENYERFPQHYSLAQMLYFSPKAIHKIRQITLGKFSYIVPMTVGKIEFILAEILQANILSGPYEIVNKYSKKSIQKELFNTLNFPVSPGCTQFTNKDDFVNKLTLLILNNLSVTRWVFKIDIEFNSRGSAWFSLEGVKQFIEMKQNPANIQMPALRELVFQLLPIKTVFPFQQMYTFDEYMDNFLNNGGIIEAWPNSSKIQTININFLIEPSGQYQILNTSTSIIIREMTKIGCVYPQTILQINIDSLLSPLTENLYQNGYFGYVTLSLLAFNNLFYTKSLRFGMDEEISANFLAQSMDNDCFTYLPFLYHPPIQEQKYTELFSKCRKDGVSFDIEKKSGTLILLTDSITSGVLSILSLGTPKKAVKLITEALNFLMQFGASVSKSNAQQKQDFFYFIDIVSKLRALNSEQQQ